MDRKCGNNFKLFINVLDDQLKKFVATLSPETD